MARRTRVLVISGGSSGEHEVSLASGRMVAKHLDPKKYRVDRALITRSGRWVLAGGRSLALGRALERIRGRYDVAFIALHGRFGEDGTIQALLESIDLPYTGSGPATSALAMDKVLSNRIVAAAGFAVPGFQVVERGQRLYLKLPVVVKPIDGGSSVDTTIARTLSAERRAVARLAHKYDRALVQRFVKGRELTCGVIEDRRGNNMALAPTEIIPRTNSWFDYHAKYTPGASTEETPARLTRGQTRTLQQLAVSAHTLLGCRGMSRSDFILSGGRFHYLETNTIPGLTAASLLPQGAAAVGISFPALLDRVIQAAVRHRA